MIISTGTGNGLKSTISTTIKNAEGNILISHINQQQETESIYLNPDELFSLKEINGVKNIKPIIKKSAIINTNNNLKGIVLKGVSEQYKQNLITKNIIQKNYLDNEINNEIIISKQQKENLNVNIGDECIVHFLSNKNNIKKRKFKITGTYDMNNLAFNETYCFTKIEMLQKMQKWHKDDVTNYEIYIKNSARTNLITDEINSLLNHKLIAKSTESRFPSIFNWINLFDKNILFIILIMSIICTINMTNALLILILERIKMIGTLKSFGCSNFSILKIFLYNSWNITIQSMMVGNIIGIGVCLIQKYTRLIKLNPESYFVNYLPIEIDLTFVLIINMLTFLIIQLSIITAYYIINKSSPSNILKIN